MKTVEIEDAETHLSALIDEAAAGEEIILAKSGTPRARLVPVEEKKNTFATTFGIAQGRIQIGDDFDAPLPKEMLREWGVE